ncbi:hypothetical protein PLICRDRAFT_53836 [Plicaturopsis crispa FD-325 SS-3]|nr:hypothetical protein PLICRDRAFT_53836 [Plicaturopsis crispa FD-325 SS-3]
MKRARSSDAEENRDPDLYFEDGSIVLSASAHAGNGGDSESETKVVTYFRVHKTVLASHAGVFKDMFSITPPAVMEEYDGVPLVILHDDPKDLKAFLHIIYDAHPISVVQPRHPETANILRGPLKLATKYQADTLREWMVTVLERDWPSTLDEWDALSQPRHKSAVPLDPAQVICIARESNVPSILPLAFYMLSELASSRWTEYPDLTRQDFQVLAAGIRKMGETMIRLTDSLLPWICPCGRDECFDGALHFKLLFYEMALRGTGILPELLYIQRELRIHNVIYEMARFDLCSICDDNMADTIESMRMDIFSCLPKIFAVAEKTDEP